MLTDRQRERYKVKKRTINKDKKKWRNARWLQTDRRHKEMEDKQRQKGMDEGEMLTDRQKERYKRKGR